MKNLFETAFDRIVEVVMFENWLRFYFITEKPEADDAEALFLAVPEQGMQRIGELHGHLLPLAESLNGKKIDFETSRSAVCTYVVTEVACGTPPNRRAIIAMLAELESTPLATPEELLELIERRSLYGRGCGFVDMSLLASTLLGDQTLIWTLDKRLESVAVELKRAHRPLLHS